LIGRRDMLAVTAGALGTAFLPRGSVGSAVAAGRLRQSVSRWPFASIASSYAWLRGLRF